MTIGHWSGIVKTDAISNRSLLTLLLACTDEECYVTSNPEHPLSATSGPGPELPDTPDMDTEKPSEAPGECVLIRKRSRAVEAGLRSNTWWLGTPPCSFEEGPDPPGVRALLRSSSGEPYSCNYISTCSSPRLGRAAFCFPFEPDTLLSLPLQPYPHVHSIH
jgi:hypothetical protein